MSHKVNEDIVNKLIQDGLTPEKFQECYERYVWHVNFYEPKLKELEEELKGYKFGFNVLLDKANELKDKCINCKKDGDNINYIMHLGQLIGIQNTLVHVVGSDIADNTTYQAIVGITDDVMNMNTENINKAIGRR